MDGPIFERRVNTCYAESIRSSALGISSSRRRKKIGKNEIPSVSSKYRLYYDATTMFDFIFFTARPSHNVPFA